MEDRLSKLGRLLYKAYMAVGIAAMAFICGSVIFTVIMRYFFGITFTFLEELITLVFAFEAFWGIGCCALEGEHVVIDFFFNKIPSGIRRYVDIADTIIVIATMLVIDYYSIGWIQTAGKTLSNGLRIKYVYIYSAMPIGITVSLLFVIYRLVCLILGRPALTNPAKEDEAP